VHTHESPEMSAVRGQLVRPRAGRAAPPARPNTVSVTGLSTASLLGGGNPIPASAPGILLPGFPALQETAGNGAVIQMLHRSGHQSPAAAELPAHAHPHPHPHTGHRGTIPQRTHTATELAIQRYLRAVCRRGRPAASGKRRMRSLT
jgi:hypothetical protein